MPSNSDWRDTNQSREVLSILHEERFVDQEPVSIYASLLDKSIRGYRVPDVFLRTWIAVTLGSGVATAHFSAQATATVTGYQTDAVPLAAIIRAGGASCTRGDGQP